MVRKIGKHTSQTGPEMQLIVQIGNYSIDRVILDMGSDANVLPKKNLGKDGETCAAVISNSTQNGESSENHPHGMII